MTERKLRLVLAVGCFAAGGIVAGTTWNRTIDANVYLDMARFVAQGDWSAALNPFWGLSYAWIMGAFFYLFGSEPQRIVLAIRVTNVLMVLLAVAAFDLMLGALLDHLRSRPPVKEASLRAPVLGGRSLCIVAYTLLLWSFFCIGWPALISPDMLVAAVFFAAFGLLLRVANGRHVIMNSALIGLCLVFGYYTKAVFVPIGLLLFVCLTICLFQQRKAWPALPVGLLILVAGCAPYYRVVACHTDGIPNAASLNYAWHVNGLWNFIHWHGEGQGFGTPLHPTQQLTHGLRAYAFAEPIHATYPPWYDPSYFYAGFQTHFHLSRQLAAIKFNATAFAGEMGKKPLVWIVLLSVVLLSMMHNRLAGSWKSLLALWPVLLPALAGCALFQAVHIEIRYVQPMVCCLLLLLVIAAAFPVATAGEKDLPQRRLAASSAMPAIVVTLIASIALLSIGVRAHHMIQRFSLANPLDRDREWIAAQQLRQMAIQPHTKVAMIGEGMDCLWAFLAQVRIVAEVPHDYDNAGHLGDANDYWTAPVAARQTVLNAFGTAGAAFVIADPPAGTRPEEGWLPLAGTGYYYHSLRADTLPVNPSASSAE